MYLHGCVFFSFFKSIYIFQDCLKEILNYNLNKNQMYVVLFKLNELFLIFARDL